MNECDRLLLVAARSAEDLRAQLAVDDRLLLERDDVGCVPSGGPYRLGIINADAKRLARARRILEGDAPWRGRHDIWFTVEPLLSEGRGSVAIVFPGVEQRFDPVVDDVASHFGLPAPELVGDDPSVLRVGRLLDTALRRIGVEPAAVAGHSIGEWSAMVSAGLFSTESVIASVDPTVFELPGCLFAALGCGGDLAQEILGGLEDVVISHDNCPHQSIICGQEHAIAAARQQLKQRGVHSVVLNFRSGFHSPMLAPYLDRVSGIAKLPMDAATVPIWSATTASPFPSDEDAIRRLVIRHLLEPVRFRTLIERLYASGIRAFVQAGMGSLTGFIEDTLAGREYIAVAANVANQRGLLQLQRAAVALWVEGASVELGRLAATHSPPIVVESPETNLLSQPAPEGWVRLSERSTDAASRELSVRRYLGASERDEYDRRAPRGRHHWLMGRIAAKDAVRRWLWAQGAGPLSPDEVTIETDPQGRPTVIVPGTPGIFVSIAHCGGLAVAIADDHAVGIDVEVIESRECGLETIALSEHERLLLDRAVCVGDPRLTRSEAFTRFWAAKEAVSKADGRGLLGRPTAVAVSAVDNDHLKVFCRRDSAARTGEYDVDTRVVESPADIDGVRTRYIVAWTKDGGVS
jgi:phosphopantetheinyl transferase